MSSKGRKFCQSTRGNGSGDHCFGRLARQSLEQGVVSDDPTVPSLSAGPLRFGVNISAHIVALAVIRACLYSTNSFWRLAYDSFH